MIVFFFWKLNQLSTTTTWESFFGQHCVSSRRPSSLHPPQKNNGPCLGPFEMLPKWNCSSLKIWSSTYWGVYPWIPYLVHLPCREFHHVFSRQKTLGPPIQECLCKNSQAQCPKKCFKVNRNLTFQYGISIAKLIGYWYPFTKLHTQLAPGKTNQAN